jgi:hypothetical protein
MQMVQGYLKVNYGVMLNEETRRRMRARVGRGGLATRSEIRNFLDMVVTAAIADLPEPKVRRRKVERPAPKPVDGTAVCAHCGHPRSEHGDVSASCPLNRTVKPGSRFTGVQ